MRKQFRFTIILVIVFLLLVGSLFMVRYMNDTKSKREEEESLKDVIHLYSVSQGDIKGFSYTVSGDILEFEKKDNEWILKQDSSIALKKDAVTMMLSNIENLTADRKISGKEAKEQDFGFENPSNVISVTTAKSTKTFTFGMQNEITREYYLIVDHDIDNIYVINTSIPTTFMKSIEELTETEDTTVEETDTKN